VTDDDALARFLELVAREMDASDVRAEPRGTVETSHGVLVVPLGERSEVVVRFAEVPPDVDARQRRLEMLASAFASAVEMGAKRPRPSRRSLRRELEKLAAKAEAVDAVVIDAHSPIVWGAIAGPVVSAKTNVIPLNAEARERVERIHDSHRDLMAAIESDKEPAEEDRASATPPPVPPSPLTTRAVAEVRDLPATEMLHRGGHLAYNRRDADYGVVARSFAAIYVLILVFDKAFDMIRAERALREGLPMIERLVLALPPMDPEPAPTAGVIALRRPRRRR
jgi:hypothetical protein